MAFTNNRGQTQTSMSEINVTPLVDVVLVLLIIFMITAPMIQRAEASVMALGGAPRARYCRCDHVGPERSGTLRAVKMPIGCTDSIIAVRCASNAATAVERTSRAGSDSSISLQYSMTMYRDARF